MSSIEARVARLERRRRAAAGLDPVALCARAGAYYEYGPDVASLPADMTLADRHLVAALLDTLWRTEPENWWRHDLPLPLGPGEFR